MHISVAEILQCSQTQTKGQEETIIWLTEAFLKYKFEPIALQKSLKPVLTQRNSRKGST
jgi:hypothetical protein